MNTIDLDAYNASIPMTSENIEQAFQESWNYYSNIGHNQALDTRCVFWVKDGNFVRGPKYIPRIASLRMINDFVMAMETGSIPYFEKHGADGVMLNKDGLLECVEYKLCELNMKRFCKGPNGGLRMFSGSPLETQKSKPGGWTGKSMAKWKVSPGKEYTKNMKTFIGLKLEQKEDWIGIWSLTGDQVLKFFEGQPNEKNVSIHQVITNGECTTKDNKRYVGLEKAVEMIRSSCTQKIGNFYFQEDVKI